MPQIVPIQLEDGVTIYIEANDVKGATAPTTSPFPQPVPTERRRGGQKGISTGASTLATAGTTALAQSFQAIEGTIRTYTNHTLRAFKDMASGNVEKVTLEFGIQIGGEAGVPYVTKGTAESNLTITVECTFNE